MADTFARMRQLIGNTAEWAANDIVLGNGELGVERVSASEVKIKCGDGAKKWSTLPYITDSSVITAVQAALNGKVNRSGDTMTGALILFQDGVAPKEAVTVTQLNSEKTRVDNALQTKLSLAGGKMTGPLLLAADATQNLEPVTLQQLGTEFTTRLANFSAGVTFVGAIDPTQVYAALTPTPASGHLYIIDATGAVDPSWTANIAAPAPANVALGDHLIWSTADNKFHYYPASSGTGGGGGGAYVPLAGTNALVGGLAWTGAAGSRKGTTMLNGKGASIDDWVIDAGNY